MTKNETKYPFKYQSKLSKIQASKELATTLFSSSFHRFHRLDRANVKKNTAMSTWLIGQCVPNQYSNIRLKSESKQLFRENNNPINTRYFRSGYRYQQVFSTKNSKMK